MIHKEEQKKCIIPMKMKVAKAGLWNEKYGLMVLKKN